MNEFIDVTGFNEDEEIYWSNAAVCPYCGFINEQDCETSAFYNDGNWEFTCGNCDKTFRMETYISYSYTTRKISEAENE